MCVWSLVNERIGSAVYRDEARRREGEGEEHLMAAFMVVVAAVPVAGSSSRRVERKR